ncbi:DNA-binding CsgD family transcriptional regulator [Catenulispora sp. EB89]|uniref:LuxR C-terminal-related transcriptional regulator n=1 Tax=Catenulispora sp. EB89 TaxID=3156257 RepID=UPI003514082E
MADGELAPAAFPEIGEREMALYRLFLRKGRLTVDEAVCELGLAGEDATRSVEVLIDLHLLRAEPEPVGADTAPAYLPVPPSIAAAYRVAPVEADLRRRLADAERARAQLLILDEVYAAGRPSAGSHRLDEILDLATVLDLIERLAVGCRTEVMTVQPGGPREPDQLEQAITRDLAMIGRGVRMRTLYQHTARLHQPTQEYVARITAAGAEVRTRTDLSGRMLVFDREVAILPHRLSLDGAIVVREPSMVFYFCGLFDQSWSFADTFVPLRQWDSALDDVKQAVVRLLAEGMKDEMIARRLGMSLRTCRKHIAELLEGLGAASRFQAGYLARARPDLAGPQQPDQGAQQAGPWFEAMPPNPLRQQGN